MSIKKKEYYKENRGMILVRQREYNARPENKARNKEFMAEYYQKNKDRMLAHKKEYYQKNKDSIIAQIKRYKAKPKVKAVIKAYNARYYCKRTLLKMIHKDLYADLWEANLSYH